MCKHSDCYWRYQAVTPWSLPIENPSCVFWRYLKASAGPQLSRTDFVIMVINLPLGHPPVTGGIHYQSDGDKAEMKIFSDDSEIFSNWCSPLPHVMADIVQTDKSQRTLLSLNYFMFPPQWRFLSYKLKTLRYFLTMTTGSTTHSWECRPLDNFSPNVGQCRRTGQCWGNLIIRQSPLQEVEGGWGASVWASV